MKKILLLFLIGFQSLEAQVQFEAKVSKATLGLNERIRIDFAMNADGDNFVPPTFEGFRVLGGPFQQMSQQWINGRGTFNKTYSYILLPNQKGVLTIKPATIEINGQVYKTNPLKVTVTAATEAPRDPNDPQPQVSADTELHLIADISSQNPYINEPITVVYKLYFSNNIGITDSRELDKPKYNDFWSQNIDIKQFVVEQGKYKGENYRYIVLKKVVLYPQKSGKLTIEPLSLDIDVQLPTNRRNVFGQVQVVEDHKKVAAGASTINVRALPEKGKPASFTGAVGKFNFSVNPSKTTLKNGESIDLNIKVSGTGNLKLFDLPKPVVPAAIEMYDPVHTEQVSTPLSGMTGYIMDKYTIIPQFKGNYPIKPMQFCYFDLGSRSYKTITSPEIIIKVLDGPTPENEVNTPNSIASTNKKTISTNEQFQFIKLKTKLICKKSNDFFGSFWFYLLLILPLICIPFLVWFKKKKDAAAGDILGNKIKLSNKLAKKYLTEAKNQIQNKEAFYIALEKAMHNFLKAKISIETSEMSKDKISEILIQKNATTQTVFDFINLTENCEFARYAPSSSVAIQQDYDKAVAIISELEKQI